MQQIRFRPALALAQANLGGGLELQLANGPEKQQQPDGFISWNDIINKRSLPADTSDMELSEPDACGAKPRTGFAVAFKIGFPQLRLTTPQSHRDFNGIVLFSMTKRAIEGRPFRSGAIASYGHLSFLGAA